MSSNRSFGVNRRRYAVLFGTSALAALLGSAAVALPAHGAGPVSPPSPTPADTAVIREFALPAPSSYPTIVTEGPDGNLWFTESSANRIGRLSPRGDLTEFPIPTAGSYPVGITIGPGGQDLWFTEQTASKIGSITTSGLITEFALPHLAGPTDIVTGPDGKLWFTEQFGGRVGKMSPSGRLLAEFPTASFNISDITVGPDGNLWVTEGDPIIARLTTSGALTEFPLPSDPDILHTATGITAGPDGNLWFTETFADEIGRITPAGVVTTFPVPTTGSGAAEITVGPDRNLWFTENFTNRIGRITPAGAVTEVHIPTPLSGPWGITAGPGHKLWFTEQTAGKVASLDPATLQPPPGPCLVLTHSKVLTDDVGPCAGDGILVVASHVTLDLNGHRIVGSATRPGDFAGVHLKGVRDVTVTGGTVTSFDAGVWIDHGSANKVTRMNVHDNIGVPDPASLLGDGIVAFHSSRNVISHNLVTHNGIFDGVGILGLDSNRNRIEANTIARNTDSRVGDNVPGGGTGIIINPFLEQNNPRRGESLFGNDVVGNTITDNVNTGITNLSNRYGRIRDNEIEHNGFRPGGGLGGFPGNGIGVQALFRAIRTTHNEVSGNRSIANAANGIEILSEANRITGNVTDGNGANGTGVDLRDSTQDANFHFNCDSNVWLANRWGSGGFDPPCVTAGGSGPKLAARPGAPLAAAPPGGVGRAEPFSRGKQPAARR